MCTRIYDLLSKQTVHDRSKETTCICVGNALWEDKNHHCTYDKRGIHFSIYTNSLNNRRINEMNFVPIKRDKVHTIFVPLFITEQPFTIFRRWLLFVKLKFYVKNSLWWKFNIVPFNINISFNSLSTFISFFTLFNGRYNLINLLTIRAILKLVF